MRLPDTESTDLSAPRVALRPAVASDVRAIDGAWWPRSRDLAAELPGLVAALSQRGFTVTRVAYHRDSWDGEGRKLPVAGKVVRLGWFRTIDPQLVSLTGLDTQGRQELLVVPPTSDPRLAERVFAWIENGDHDGAASTILAAAEASLQAQPHPAPANRAAESRWESEGGSPSDAALVTGRQS